MGNCLVNRDSTKYVVIGGEVLEDGKPKPAYPLTIHCNIGGTLYTAQVNTLPSGGFQELFSHKFPASTPIHWAIYPGPNKPALAAGTSAVNEEQAIVINVNITLPK